MLLGAANLIEQRGWTQGFAAQDSDGEMVLVTSPRAAAWCAIGAINRVLGVDVCTERSIDPMSLLESHIDGDIAEWNDAPGRTASEVVSAMRVAADPITYAR